MIARQITTDELRNSERRTYNEQSWNRNIDSYSKYGDVVFYQADKDDIYEYDRHFVEYTLPEGLRLFSDFGYSGGISDGGFYRLSKQPITKDGKTFNDMVEMSINGNNEGAMLLAAELRDSNFFNIQANKVQDQDGNMVLINNTPQARKWMSDNSKKHDMTFTKGF